MFPSSGRSRCDPSYTSNDSIDGVVAELEPVILSSSCGLEYSRAPVLVLLCLGTTACGDSDASVSNVPLTVFVPSGPNAPPGGGFAAETTSVEYEINCFPGAPGASAEGATLHLAGTLARTGSFDGGSSGPTAVWKGLVELRPGSCVIQLISRADRELICNIEEPLTIEPGSPSELFLEMPCHTYVHCTTTPLPDSVRSAKTVCESLVGSSCRPRPQPLSKTRKASATC